MNWDDLRYFLALARTGRLSEAGRVLGVDHATISRRVSSLEDEISVRLFDRGPNGYVLTSAGENLVPNAERVEATILLAADQIADHNEQLSGPVRVAVPEGVAASIVVEAAQSLCETHPQLQIQLLANSQKHSLAKREADIMVSLSRPQSGRLRVQKIADFTLHLYATENYIKSQPEIKSLEDLQHVRGVGYVPDLIPDKQLDYIPKVEFNLQPHLTSTSVHVQAAAILNNAGVGIMHDFMASKHPQLQKVLPSQVSIHRTFWSVVHEDYADLERVRVVTETIVEHLRKRLRS